MKKKLYTILTILFILLPLGLLSEYDAWGEWDKSKFEEMIGFVPKGIKDSNPFFIIDDYGQGNAILYYLSAIIGGMAIYFILYLITKTNKK